MIGSRKIWLITLGVFAATLVATIVFLQRTRTIEGTWVSMFEGESFFEGRSLSEVCGPRYDDLRSWLYYRAEPGTAEAAIMERYGDTGWFVSEYGPYPATAYEVEFRGHKEVLGLSFGHLGGWASAYKVDEFISLTPIESTYCDTSTAAREPQH